MQCVIDRIDGRNGECTPGIFQQSCMGQMFDFAAANKQHSRYRFRRDAGVATVKGDLYASAHGALNGRSVRQRTFTAHETLCSTLSSTTRLRQESLLQGNSTMMTVWPLRCLT